MAATDCLFEYFQLLKKMTMNLQQVCNLVTTAKTRSKLLQRFVASFMVVAIPA
jgi:hypothetical protein